MIGKKELTMEKSRSFGRCKKCGGTLYLDRDFDGWYEACLQCGYMHDLAAVYQDKQKVKVAAG